MTEQTIGSVRVGRVGIFAGLLAVHPATVQAEIAREIETLGFGALWFGEPVPGRDAFVQASIFLHATKTLAVASGIASIYARDSYAAHAAGRALAELSRNRFVLGLGVSHPTVIHRRGHEYQRPVPAMRRYLDGIDEAAGGWRGLAAPMPPIVLAALREKMLSLAKTHTAGAFTYFVTDGHTEWARKILGEGSFLACDLPVVLADTRNKAREVGDWHTARYLQIDTYRNSLLEHGFSERDVTPPGSDTLFDALVAWGSPTAIADRIQARLRSGADHVVLNFAIPNPKIPYTRELRELGPVLARRFA